MKFKTIYLHYLIVFILALVTYSNTFDHEYAWDDTIVLTSNERVQKGFEGIPEVFRNIKADEAQYRYGYRPISLTSFALEVGLFGMNPKVSHVINVLLYGLVSILLFGFLRRVFSEKHIWFSLLITLLFVSHPIHSEVVANVKSRDEILTMLFGLCSLLFVLNYLAEGRRKLLNILGALFCLLLSFLSKENGIVFTAMMALVIFYKLPRKSGFGKDKLIYLLPVAGLALLMLVRWFVYSDLINEDNSIMLSQQGVYDNDRHAGNPLELVGFTSVLANSFFISIKNLMLLIVPYPLLHDYSHMQVVSWGHPLVIVSVLLHAFLVFVVVRNFKKRSVIVFGILFYFIAISIYLHVLRVGPDYMAERFLFIPSIGFFIVVTGLIELVVGKFELDLKLSSPKIKAVLVSFGLLVLVGLGVTRNRNNAWFSNETLLETDIQYLESSVRANYNYASLLHDRYYKSSDFRKPALQKQVLHHYELAAKSSDASLVVMMDLGNAYMEFGQPEKAKSVFEKGVHHFEGNVVPIIQLGKYHISREEFVQAEKVLVGALDISKVNHVVYYFLAVSQFKQGKIEEAIDTLLLGEAKAEKIEEVSYYELTGDLLRYQKNEKFKEYYQKALKFSPDNETLKKKLNEVL